MSAASIAIRQARAEDIPRLAELRTIFLQELGKQFDPQRCFRETEAFLRANLGESMHALVAEDEGALVACAFLQVRPQLYHPRYENGQPGEVLNVYTVPEYRKRGLAARLMQEVLVLAKTLGLGSLRLTTTEAGRPLYEAMGFEDDSTVNPPMTLPLNG